MSDTRGDAISTKAGKKIKHLNKNEMKNKNHSYLQRQKK
jgi:hypothetical protein